MKSKNNGVYIMLSVIFIFCFTFNVHSRDNLEGLSFGVEGGMLYAPNAKKFSIRAERPDYRSHNIELSATNFVTIGAYARYGVTDDVGLEFGLSQSFTSEVQINMYRFEVIYMITPYRENRYYVKFGGVRNQTKSSFFEQAGKFAYSTGLIYTVGVEMGYSSMPLNFSISYLGLTSDFDDKLGWDSSGSGYDVSGIMIKSSFNIKL